MRDKAVNEKIYYTFLSIIACISLYWLLMLDFHVKSGIAGVCVWLVIFPVSTPSTIDLVIDVRKPLSLVSSDNFLGMYLMPLSIICLVLEAKNNSPFVLL